MRLYAAITLTALSSGCVPIDSQNAPSEMTSASTKGPVHLTVSVDPGKAQAGQQIRILLTARAEAGVALASPLLNTPQDLGPFHILAQSDMREIPLDDGGRSWSQELLVDTFEPGQHDIPAFDVRFADTRTEPPTTVHISSEAINIQIASLHEDISQASIKDIRGWIMLPGDAWWPWIVGAGVLGGIGLWFASRGRTARLVPPPPTAAELARASLADLRVAGLLERGDSNGFYVRLSNIVRKYIEGRFGLHAPRKTTNEFLHHAGADAHLSETQQQQLGAFLQISDLVKFAKHAPPVDHGHLALQQAESFIDDTEEVNTLTEHRSDLEAAPC